MANMEKPPDRHYRCIKTSLKSVVKNGIVVAKLTDAVLRANGIMIHTLQLLKLYLLHCLDDGDKLPTLNRQFVTSVMKVLCRSPTQGRPPSDATTHIKQKLSSFYEQHYKEYVPEELSYKHMNTVLDYLSTEVITMYENNIKQNYVEYVERYVNVSWHKKEQVADISRSAMNTKSRQNALCACLRRVKDDLLSPHQEKTSDPLYHPWIDEQRCLVVPARKLQKDNLRYDIQCSPQDYLPCMLRMMRVVEAHGTSVKNACPLRSNVVPKHVRIDTVSLVNLCFTEEQGKRSDYTSKGNLVKFQDITWGFFFKTNMKCFRAQGYRFDHQIETDGVGCSILLKRKDLLGKRKREDLVGKPVIRAKRGNGDETYIDEVADYRPLRGRTVVAIDPNMSDLLYCVDGDTKNQTKFRYTQDTRRKETKVKKYRNYVQDRKQGVIDGKSVVEWEAELSAYNRKTTNFERFKAYVKKKNELNRRLSRLYNEYIFRKLKLGGYMRRQITEARLLKRFEKLFGSGAETIVAMGDWDQRQHRKFKEPVKGKGFRVMFRKAGYDVFLVDEFRTSSRCSACEQGECRTFRVCKNPRPYRSGMILRHGLVRCKTCSRLWNRDTNAASNIWKVATSAIRGEGRPEYLRRAGGSITTATSAGNHVSSDFLDDSTKPRFDFLRSSCYPV